MGDSTGRQARFAHRTWWRSEPSTRERRYLTALVAAVLILNAIDAVSTALWVYVGIAKEANPLMARLIENHPLLFVATKVALVSGGSFILWKRRTEPLAVVAIFVAFLAYYAVLLAHLDALSRVVAWWLDRRRG
ncbi:MAG: hypothetical protein HYV07_33805 [Deltaproteobacteria bacterium]|nr:hypothetical protein [Deltaproteobacteria bacterium]